MKKIIKTKLVLQREMIRALLDKDLAHVGAGQEHAKEAGTIGAGTCPLQPAVDGRK
jgi:hypothetical protein